MNSNIKAVGFPSPAEDFLELGLDLNQYLIKHPVATFFVRATGKSMPEVGILDGDLLIVDRALTPQDGSIVIAVIEGKFFLKRLKILNEEWFLYAVNRINKPVAVASIDQLEFWGVVTYAIHSCVTGL